MKIPPGRSTRNASANIRSCNSADFRWCSTRIANADEKVWSVNGSRDASPQTAPTVTSFCAFSLTVDRWSYSSEVTRAARAFNSAVAAPDPAPISKTCSPSRVPASTQGRICLRVTYRQIADEQISCSAAFIKARPQIHSTSALKMKKFETGKVPSAVRDLSAAAALVCAAPSGIASRISLNQSPESMPTLLCPGIAYQKYKRSDSQ